MAAEGRELIDFEVLAGLQSFKLRLIDACQKQVIRVSLIVQGQIKNFFDA